MSFVISSFSRLTDPFSKLTIKLYSYNCRRGGPRLHLTHVTLLVPLTQELKAQKDSLKY